MPCLVYEMGIGAHGINLNAHRLKLLVLLGDIDQLGRADERKVGRIEKEDRPLALHIVAADGLETAVVECLNLEFRKTGIDNRFHSFLFLFGL